MIFCRCDRTDNSDLIYRIQQKQQNTSIIVTPLDGPKLVRSALHLELVMINESFCRRRSDPIAMVFNNIIFFNLDASSNTKLGIFHETTIHAILHTTMAQHSYYTFSKEHSMIIIIKRFWWITQLPYVGSSPFLEKLLIFCSSCSIYMPEYTVGNELPIS